VRVRAWCELASGAGYLTPSLAVFAVFVFYPLVRNAQLSL
jgi:ABC-type sugar transport system permease subunit